MLLNCILSLFNKGRGKPNMKKFDTQNNKRAYINSLIEQQDHIDPRYNIHLFSKERGVYSGVVRSVESRSGRADRFKYYGFIINFPETYFSLEGISGKKLANNAKNLGDVFSNSEALSEQGLNMLVVVGNCLANMGDEYSDNLGRGIYRAITKYPASEQVYINFKEHISYYLIHYVQLLDNTKHQKYISANGNDEGYSFNLRKALGLSKGNFKLLKERGFRILPYYSADDVYDDHDSKNLNQRLSLLRLARTYAHEVDDERGYHDAEKWFKKLYNDFMDNPHDTLNQHDDKFNQYCVPYIYRASMLATNDKQAWMHTVKYFYGSLYHQQAIDSVLEAGLLYLDYANLVKDFDSWVHYPRYLKVAHDIAIRNTQALHNFEDNHGIINKYHKYNYLEGTNGDYSFMLAYDAKEIVDEGQQQSNCVAGYVGSVATGQSLIMFLRKEQAKSWVTIELRQNNDNTLTMCQVFEPFNAPLHDESKQALHAWAKSNNINIAKNIGGCNDTTGWDKQYKKQFRVMQPLADSPRMDKVKKEMAEYQKQVEANKAEKAKLASKFEQDNAKIKKAV